LLSGGFDLTPRTRLPPQWWNRRFDPGLGSYFNASPPTGTHFPFTVGVNTAKLTFTNPVTSVQVEAQNNKTDIATNLTLTGYENPATPSPAPRPPASTRVTTRSC
jgi:hypothetical protein